MSKRKVDKSNKCVFIRTTTAMQMKRGYFIIKGTDHLGRTLYFYDQAYRCCYWSFNITEALGISTVDMPSYNTIILNPNAVHGLI